MFELKFFKTDASTGGGLYKGYERSLKDLEAPVLPVRDADVAVFSLMGGRGVSHTAAALANFLKEDEANIVAFFSDEAAANDRIRQEELVSGIACFPRSMKDVEARRYNSVVEDAGVIDVRAPLPTAKKLIMVGTADYKYMHELAEFARLRQQQSKDIYYVFNLVPDDKVGEVKRAMDFYKFAGCVNEVYDCQKPTRNVKLLLRNILVSEV
jgi:hypothetical protein